MKGCEPWGSRGPFWEVFTEGWQFTLLLALVNLVLSYVDWLSLFLTKLIYR